VRSADADNCAFHHYMEDKLGQQGKKGKHLGLVIGTGVDFDKIYVFCGKCCVHIDKCVFIVVKIKCMNSGRISDVCDKLTLLQNYTHFTTPDRHFIKIHTNITIFDTLDRWSCCGT
jgi:hypothetical protein